jgi:hypothetical protein
VGTVELTAHQAGVAERAANGVACSSMAGTASGVAGAAGMTLGCQQNIRQNDCGNEKWILLFNET